MFSRDEIFSMLSGTTLYHAPVAGSKHGDAEIPMHFTGDGRVFAAMGGSIKTARWAPIDGGYRLDWDGGLQGSESLIERRDGRLIAVNPSDGSVRTTISRIEDGDPEGLSSDREIPKTAIDTALG